MLQLVCTHELKSKTAIEKLMNDNVATHMYTRIEISFNINSGYFIWLQLAYMSFIPIDENIYQDYAA